MVKWFLTLVLFTLSSQAYSFAFQLGFGGLTPHFVTKKKNYCNQWNNTGVIANRSQYIRILGERYGFTYMQGHDSICSDIEGLFIHYIFDKGEWIEMGVTAGGYAFNQSNWDEYAESTPESIDAPDPVQIDYFGRNVVPVLALDIAVHLIRRESWSLKLNNIFTPIIFNHSLAVEFRF